MSVSVNESNIIGTNRLQLGVQLGDWNQFVLRQPLRDLAQAVNLWLIRIFDFKLSLSPCTHWDAVPANRTWNWTNVDSVTASIFEIGAEPLWCLGEVWKSSRIPPNMAIDPVTGLPSPADWAAYCREWVKHFKIIGKPVRFYEIVNESWFYWGWFLQPQVNNFIALFNAAAAAMRAENPNVLLGTDGTNRNTFLDYWLGAGNGADLDFLSFHKYDSGSVGQYTDAQIFSRAETFQIKTSASYYGVKDSKQKYYNTRGKWILSINSESNLNSAYDPGTDPRIPLMSGAVWLALLLKTGILEGLDYNVYFQLDTNKIWELANKTTGWGFGMIDVYPPTVVGPFYPYYVTQMVGQNLEVNDQLIESTSTNPDVSTLAWIHNGKICLLIINKTHAVTNLTINGISGVLDYLKIDETTNADNPTPIVGVVDSAQPLTLNGYAVAFLQQAGLQPVALPFHDDFMDLTKWQVLKGTFVIK